MSRAVRLVELAALGREGLPPATAAQPGSAALSGRFLATLERTSTTTAASSISTASANTAVSSSSPPASPARSRLKAKQGQTQSLRKEVAAVSLGNSSEKASATGSFTSLGRKSGRDRLSEAGAVSSDSGPRSSSKSPRKDKTRNQDSSSSNKTSHRRTQSDAVSELQYSATVEGHGKRRQHQAKKKTDAGSSTSSELSSSSFSSLPVSATSTGSLNPHLGSPVDKKDPSALQAPVKSFFSVVDLEGGEGSRPTSVALRKAAACDAVLAHPFKPIVAVRQGLVLQIFDVIARTRLGSAQLEDILLGPVACWAWIRNGTALGIVDDKALYVWPDLLSGSPGTIETVFGRPERFRGADTWQVTLLKSDASGTWTLLGGMRFDQRRQVVVGMLVLYNNVKCVSQCIEAFTGAFGNRVHVHESDRSATRDLVVFATQDKRLTVASIDDKPDRVNLSVSLPLFTEAGMEDFAVGIEIDAQLGLVFVLSKHGRCVVFALSIGARGGATAHLIFNERISASPIFSTSEYNHSTARPFGICALNRHGQILYLTADVHGILDSVRDSPDIQLVLQRRLTSCLSMRPQLLIPRVSNPAHSPAVRRMQSEPNITRAKSLDSGNESMVGSKMTDDAQVPSVETLPANSSESSDAVLDELATRADLPLLRKNPFLPTQELRRGDPELSFGLTSDFPDKHDASDADRSNLGSLGSNPFQSDAVAEQPLADPFHVLSSPQSSNPPIAFETDAPTVDESRVSLPSLSIDPGDLLEQHDENPETALLRWTELVDGEQFSSAARLALLPSHAPLLRTKLALVGETAPSIEYYSALMHELRRHTPNSTELTKRYMTPDEAVAVIAPTLFLGKKGLVQVREWWEEGLLPPCREVAEAIMRYDKLLAVELLSKCPADSGAQSQAIHLMASRIGARGSVPDVKALMEVLQHSESVSLPDILGVLGMLISRENFSSYDSTEDTELVRVVAVALAREFVTPSDIIRLVSLHAGRFEQCFERFVSRVTQVALALREPTRELAGIVPVKLLLSSISLALDHEIVQVSDEAWQILLKNGTASDLVAASELIESRGYPTLACQLLRTTVEGDSTDALLLTTHRHSLFLRRPLSAIVDFITSDKSEEAFIDLTKAACLHGSESQLLGCIALVASDEGYSGSVGPQYFKLREIFLTTIAERLWDPTKILMLADALCASRVGARVYFELLIDKIRSSNNAPPLVDALIKLGLRLNDNLRSHKNFTDDVLLQARLCKAITFGSTPMIDAVSMDDFGAGSWVSAFSLLWDSGWRSEAGLAAARLAVRINDTSKQRLLDFLVDRCAPTLRSGEVQLIVTAIETCGGSDAMVDFLIATADWRQLAQRVASSGANAPSMLHKLLERMVQHQGSVASFHNLKNAFNDDTFDGIRDQLTWPNLAPTPSKDILVLSGGTLLDVNDYILAATLLECHLQEKDIAAALSVAKRYSLYSLLLRSFTVDVSIDDSFLQMLAEGGSDSVAMKLASTIRSPFLSVSIPAPSISKLLKLMVSADSPAAIMELLTCIIERAHLTDSGLGRSSNLHNLLLLTAISQPDQTTESLIKLIHLCDLADAHSVAPLFVEAEQFIAAAELFVRGGLLAEAAAVLISSDEDSNIRQAYAFASSCSNHDLLHYLAARQASLYGVET